MLERDRRRDACRPRGLPGGAGNGQAGTPMLAGSGTSLSQVLGPITLATWLLTASIGAYMLRRLVTRNGLRRQRRRPGGLSPRVLYAHFSLALTGLAVWLSYLLTGWPALAWIAVGVVMPAIGLGLSTVTLWTPFPDPPVGSGAGRPRTGGPGRPGSEIASPAEDRLAGPVTDDLLASAAADEVLIARLVDEVVASSRADPAAA
ncbi:MAG TPA: hypothetical protein VE343_13580, partial [Streptosporangiaceae bacterium]|nr:hypothetical protein [Streptosporangiaceae bacterium]